MKKLLLIVLKNTTGISGLVEKLKNCGFNASICLSKSLKNLVQDEYEEPLFLSLSHVIEQNKTDTILMFIILDENSILKAKEIIREYTENFTKMQGGLATMDLKDFAGSV